MKNWIKRKIDSLFWVYSDKIKHEQAVKIELKPFHDLKCSFLETEVNKKYEEDNIKWTHREEVINIKEACLVEPVYANVIFGFNHIFRKSVFCEALSPSVPKYLNSLIRKNNISIDEAVVFDGDIGSNYFHLFSDILPKLWMIDKYRIDKKIPLLIGEKTFNTAFFQYLYKNTLISRYNWVVLKNYISLKKACLLRPMPYDAEYFNRTKQILSENFNKKKYPDRVFVTRSVKSGRYIENFNEIKTVLNKYAFHVFDTNEMALGEQVSLYQGLKKLVTIHGAGNANIIFTEPGIKFLEINPRNRISSQYYWLSNVSNIDYNVILGGDLPYVGNYPEKGFYLDPVKFEHYIKDWLLA